MLISIIRKILLIILASALLLAQFSFIPNLPAPLSALNLPLAAILVALIFFGPSEATVAAVFFGFFLDSWHFLSFGNYLLAFLLTLIAAQVILNNWLTDRSFFSFAVLTLIVSLVYDILWSTVNLLFNIGSSDSFFLFSWGFLKHALFSALCLVVVCSLSFIFLSFFSRRLKPVFLKIT